MENSFKKLRRGLFYIFILTCSLTVIFLSVQSCQRNSDYIDASNFNNEKELINFRNAIKISEQKLKEKKYYSKTTEEFEKLAVDFEREIRPAGLSLIRSYGITDSEIIAEFGSLSDPRITEAAELILYEEDLLLQGKTMDIFDDTDYFYAINFIGINTLQAQTVGGCLGEAAGIKLITDAAQRGLKKLGKKGAMKLLAKTASRYLGWLGAAVMVLEFSECMGWSDVY